MRPCAVVAVLLLVVRPPILAQVPDAAPIRSSSGDGDIDGLDGRRDPFVRLFDERAEPRPTMPSVDGVQGVTASQLSLRGVLKSQAVTVALVQGPDRKTYLVHAGDRLADGVIKAIVPEGLVILQDTGHLQGIGHATLAAGSRDVRSLLRSVEDAKP